ncbi:DUF692 domain-containing protein [Thalassolituus oleivorans]|uniref:UPF0276 protein TOL_1612 n=1 Tax=Thalassolituus oleivorans MIL-1 TaxID=1298593 RepID=M5DRJ6_9GAMM|nr:DUF692 domain-containing protein [Thalassolituus oleivorans]APR67252.1 hypothetical protein CN03_10135 [Thalassolituus oleivorans]PCI48578.1 MAG: DUF692 domain-containing protein [Oceanospirillales bacterium]PHQ84751.1 MAG: DUF692 domain-containing protein [Thalassobium sp.]CCU72036.1 hypothetical protein TOL_1612 [Thalassolituus oleivorans MIL-1]|tara:strand:- start:455 stop:1327 length:873 start_codon:yes stop_codon:yes gene_type:complete
MDKSAFNRHVQGAGLGLRRGLMAPLSEHEHLPVDFMEIAPENWIGLGGRLAHSLRSYTERYDFLCHGLSLSIGSPAPLDLNFVRQVKRFLDEHGVLAYSEHLSYCGDEGHLYDLLPIPFTDDAVNYVADRISQVQDILGQRLIIENVSAYAEPGKAMEEAEFVAAVLNKADCDLLLDVNNVYVNSINHGSDALAFIKAMPTERIRYLHVAGHFDEAPDLLIDTHGDAVKDIVWDLLKQTYEIHGVLPTLLERDFNFPAVEDLFAELEQIRSLQHDVENQGKSRTNVLHTV